MSAQNPSLIDHYALLEVISREPSNAEHHAALADFYEEHGNIVAAVSSYQNAVDLDPNNASYHNSLALLITDSERSLHHFQTASSLDPENPIAHYNFASALADAGKSELAVKEYRNALRLDPSLPDVEEKIHLLSVAFETPVFSSFQGIPVDEIEPARYTDSPAWKPVFRHLDMLDKVFASRPGFETEYEKILSKRRDLKNPSQLLVFVVGKGNFGKSSLINCLLEREVAPVNFLPKTWCIHLYHSIPVGQKEYTEIRRAGIPGMKRLDIEDAKRVCDEQEKEIAAAEKIAKASGEEKQDQRTSVRFKHQIIEVNWYYANLALPENIVLVDAPGFDQYRLELEQPKLASIGSTHGVAYDMQDIYEDYYPRATLVLWAFKASKQNDRSTAEVFAKLWRHGKRILGVITYVDTVPQEQRPELLSRMRNDYGDVVREFFPVVTGNKSSEFGLGVKAVQDRLIALSPVAEAEKLEEARQFCRVQAQNGTEWLEGIGNTLISNITQIAIYCNSVSTKLLTEAGSREKNLRQHLQSQLNRRTPGLDNFVKSLLMDEIRRHPAVSKARDGDSAAKEELRVLYQNRLAKYIEMDAINDEVSRQLDLAGKSIASEGTRQAAGQKLKQIKLMTGGETQERPIKTTIRPPDVSRIKIPLPNFNVTLPPGGCIVFLLVVMPLAFGGSYIGLHVFVTLLGMHH